MSPRERVIRTGRVLATIVAVRSLVLGTAAALGTWTAVTVLAALAGQARPAWALALAVLAGVAITVAALRRAGAFRLSAGAVALWIEEQLPALRYALVTAIETPQPAPALHQAIGASDWSPHVRRAATRALRVPVVLLVGALVAVVAADEITPVLHRVAEEATGRRTGPLGPGTLDIVATVTPPTYARLPSQSARNPATLRALEGSVVTFEARGDTLRAVVDSTTIADAARPERITMRLGAHAVAVRLEGRGGSRLVALEPVPDSSPVLTLRLPVRDTVVREPSGRVSLRADARDDLGLRRAWFEYIVSSGEGEAFTFRSGVVGAQMPAGSRQTSLQATLSLDSMALRPGDIVHLRAVAIDLRPDSARAIGSSETRVIRVARAGEFDSVAIEAAAPPEADKSL
ncbi:MAG TPA: hypothetical protein VF178_03240, partial [Gemmatimonadaceae bacterium]